MQTAVSMYIVLGSKIKSHMDEEVLEGWMTAYLGETKTSSIFNFKLLNFFLQFFLMHADNKTNGNIDQ